MKRGDGASSEKCSKFRSSGYTILGSVLLVSTSKQRLLLCVKHFV